MPVTPRHGELEAMTGGTGLLVLQEPVDRWMQTVSGPGPRRRRLLTLPGSTDGFAPCAVAFQVHRHESGPKHCQGLCERRIGKELEARWERIVRIKTRRRARGSLSHNEKDVRMNRWLVWVPLSLSLAACGSSAGNGAPFMPSPSPAPHKLGDAVAVSGWLVTLKSMKLTLQNGSILPTHTDAMLLVLEVTAQNTSDHRATASASVFHCRGTEGTSYVQVAAGQTALDSPVAAGSTTSGQVVFEVPIGTHEFTVFYEDAFSSPLAAWHLSVSPTQ